MAVTGVGSYGNIYESMYSQKSREKKALQEERTDGKSGVSEEKRVKNNSNEEYLKGLQKQMSYVNLEIGTGLNMKKDNKVGTVTMNPALLEKMQNDPDAAAKYTQLIKDIERAEKTVGAYYNALGGVVEHTSHWYIDENGKYSHFGYVRRDDKLNKKLREEAAENAKKLVEKTREKAAKKKEELKETLEKAEGKVQQLLSEKVSHSESEEIYLDTDDMQMILEAVREKDEKNTGENTTKERVGIHLDMKL